MTETNPAGTVGGIVPAGLEGDEARLAAFARQGRFMFGVEMSVRGEDEREVPWDGASPGRLLVRGPCVVSGYFGADAPAVDGGGWFDTGDIAVVHPDAVMQITDRAKDVIKSGGEWISSIAIEEAAASHAHVEACAVIGIAHEKWGERPLLFIKARPSARLSEDAMRTHPSARPDRWCTIGRAPVRERRGESGEYMGGGG